jgi:hypothetical protein
MAEQTPTLKWSVKGNTYATDENGKIDPALDKDIPVYELEKSFEYPDDPTIPSAGKAIDANLAIAFIKNFHDKLPEIPKKFLNGNKFVDQEPSKKDLTEFEDWVINLLKYSSAITFDKSVLLKTLSQPECEGIRFYLCLKEISVEPKEVLSLVTVGIDRKGKDLGYDFSSEKRDEIKTGNINVATQSYNSEYAHPPPRTGGRSIAILGELAWADNFIKIL